MQDHEEFCVMLEMQQKHDSTWTLDRDDAGATMIIYHLSLCNATFQTLMLLYTIKHNVW